jgi:hypothetical protein
LSQAAWVQPSHPNASHRICHRAVFLHSSSLFYLLSKSCAYPVSLLHPSSFVSILIAYATFHDPRRSTQLQFMPKKDARTKLEMRNVVDSISEVSLCARPSASTMANSHMTPRRANAATSALPL